MSGDNKKIIAFNYFGGKFTWVDQLEKHFPHHIHFIDVFCGSLAVTLNKKPSKIETANDINTEVINFFNVLRKQTTHLLAQLQLTPISRHEYNQCWEVLPTDSDLERARKFYVRVRQSFYGLGVQRRNKGWQLTVKHSAAKGGETVSKWKNALKKLPAIIDRLTSIQFECKNWKEVIINMDFPGAFFYCDPPYDPASRKSTNDYKYEFTQNDHRELAMVLHSIVGKAMISGYDSPLMRELYHDWTMVIFPKKKNNIRSGEVQECIWMNYKLTNKQHEFQFEESINH